MVHSHLKKYAKYSSERRWPPRTLNKKDAEGVIDSIVDDMRGILVRHLGDFYVKAWSVYSSIARAEEDPASDDMIHNMCLMVFEEMKQRVRFQLLICFVDRTVRAMIASIFVDHIERHTSIRYRNAHHCPLNRRSGFQIIQRVMEGF